MWYMKKRRLKKKAILFIGIVLLLLFILLLIGIYFFAIGPVSKNKELKNIEIKEDSTYMTIASELKENHLIRSELFYKLYIKLNQPEMLQKGTYQLSENMGVSGIIKVFEKGNIYNPDAVTLTVPEGRHIEQVAEYASNVTNNSKESLFATWDNKDFLNEVISKYWFVTDEILNSKIRHPLEGYLFPSTYELQNKDVTGEYIAYKMLDQMGVVLEEYKKEIEESKYSVHELLTMASIVEYEAILDEDRPLVAGVFYNRLDIDMKLQSCATLGYAINDWKLTYSTYDLNVDSAYNTYFYNGLPVGPGGMPSKESIEAAIHPDHHDYYYFMANVCDESSQKTYFAKTYAEHTENVRKYLTCF